ncbi:hypothetical protein [Roseibium sp.]
MLINSILVPRVAEREDKDHGDLRAVALDDPPVETCRFLLAGPEL